MKIYYDFIYIKFLKSNKTIKWDKTALKMTQNFSKNHFLTSFFDTQYKFIGSEATFYNNGWCMFFFLKHLSIKIN